MSCDKTALRAKRGRAGRRAGGKAKVAARKAAAKIKCSTRAAHKQTRRD